MEGVGKWHQNVFFLKLNLGFKFLGQTFFLLPSTGCALFFVLIYLFLIKFILSPQQWLLPKLMHVLWQRQP